MSCSFLVLGFSRASTMEAAFNEARDITIREIKCWKGNESLYMDEETVQMPLLAKQEVVTVDGNFACNGPEPGDLKVGFLYEIDQKLLRPKSPIQLKSIRVVMVTEKNELNVTVRFPSTLSLRKYFSSNEMEAGTSYSSVKKNPELDEQFVFRSKLAKEVLVRPIFPPEFTEQRHLQSFWLLPSKVAEISTSLTNPDSEDETSVKASLCMSSLNDTPGLLKWGYRKRITFIGKHKERKKSSITPRVPSVSTLAEEEEKVLNTVNRDKEVDREETTMRVTRKRKRGKSGYKKSKAAKVDVKKPSSKITKKKLILSYDRWSKERYKNAEQKMLEIMKEKGAVIGSPVIRNNLRIEARKHIGDTGLLDHLLKHMAGKVAPNGEDRFRRRHNAEGTMEYWLESADLMSVRKEAGVRDSYWTPAPGWKLGDCPSQDPICARELKLLKEQIDNIRNDVKELLLKRDKEAADNPMAIDSNTNNGNCCNNLIESSEANNKDASVELGDYEKLVKRKSDLERQLIQISESLNEMQEDMKRSGFIVKEGGANSEVVEANREEINEIIDLNEVKENVDDLQQQVQPSSASVMESKEAETAKAARAEMRQRLRSGFRICKPQGTFLWPNMGASNSSSAGNNSTTSNVLSPAQVFVADQLLVVPTPPSVSSATSPPRFLIPPSITLEQQPTSPVKTIAEKRPVIVTVSTSTICEGDNVNKFTNDNNEYCGTPSSYSTHQQQRTPLVLPPVPCAAGGDNEASWGAMESSRPLTRTYCRKQQQQQQQQIENQEAYYGHSWLALATPCSKSEPNF
ncbi:hypothetical protein IFM89_024157 [Coptis chinensis]|uniref:PTC1-like winged helix-turn-helix domain-containing protein n=1 Tax=Coptis chinensis TaxID=261450 RepID=A0A835IAX2_9MAGN|nr:hypothetical protein IFM89_024157 [Coptis chinensis]